MNDFLLNLFGSTENLELFIDTIGWIGSIEILIAYALVSMGRLKASSLWYQMLNLTGSIMLVINTLYHKAYPATFLNVAWGLIAVAILWNMFRKRGK